MTVNDKIRKTKNVWTAGQIEAGIAIFALLLAVCCADIVCRGQQSAASGSPTPSSSATPSPSNAAAPSPQDVPVIDGGLGPCSVELQVNDGNAKPVYAAKVDVHIAYGFMGVRKMDLEAQTNVNGKVKFTGLPARVHNPPLEFKATKDQLSGLATDNPATECQTQHDIVLEKLKQPAGN